MSSVDLSAIAQVMEHAPNVTAVWVFGSARGGEIRPGGDLDLAVLFNETPTLDERLELRARLQEALRFEEVDLLVLNDARSSITRFEAVSGCSVFCRDIGKRAEFVSLTAREYEYDMAFLQWGLRIRAAVQDAYQRVAVPDRYSSFHGDAGLVYRSLCLAISGHQHQVRWEAFTPEDWALLEQMALGEGVSPLMYRALKTTPDRCPAATLQALERAYYQTLAQNTLLYQELERILAALSESGASVIVLKGAALAITLYEDIALRPMGDLDLLVRQEHLARATEILCGMGYQLEEALRYLSPRLRTLIHSEANFDRDDVFPIHVELHWNLIGGQASHYRPQIGWFWEQTRPLEALPGAFVLSPTAHLLYLIAHLGLKHQGSEERLYWYHDVHRLIVRCGDELDWDELIVRARQFNWAAALYPALKGVVDRFDTPIPTGVLAPLEAAAPQRVTPLGRLPQTRWQGTLRDMATLRWRARLHLALALVFPSPAYLRWRYSPRPSWLWPLYYLYRWLDVAQDALSTLRLRWKERIWLIVRKTGSDKL